jgi:hypothetical protein
MGWSSVVGAEGADVELMLKLMSMGRDLRVATREDVPPERSTTSGIELMGG